MGILSNTVSISQFKIVGDAENTALPFDQWASQQIKEFAFRSIDESADESSLGWAEVDDFQQTDFEDQQSWLRDGNIVLSMRRDTRKIPATLIRNKLDTEQEKFLAQHPQFKRVPKDKKEELKEIIIAKLLTQTFPIPSVMDILWETEKKLLTFTNTGNKGMDDLVDLFAKTFTGLRLVTYHPMSRASELTEEKETLASLNLASNDAVLEQITANTWLGCDFLLWILFKTVSGQSTFPVSCSDGPASSTETFTAFLDSRFILSGLGNEGVQKIAVSGCQDNFKEVCSALQQGKKITEATIWFEKSEYQWKLTLKAETFHFGSFKCPSVRLEKSDDEDNENLSIFYERLHVLSEGQQLFNSLFTEFLKLRLSNQWKDQIVQITKWINE